MTEGVKFCGIMNKMDLHKAEQAGGTAVGVIVRPDSTYDLRSPKSHSLNIDRALELRDTPLEFVLVARTGILEEITDMAEILCPDRLQLAEGEDPPTLARAVSEHFEGNDFGPEIAQVIRIDADTEPDIVDEFDVDFIHLDSPGPQPGGNNVTHDWQKSRQLADRAKAQGKRVILAGALSIYNVARAIRVVEPDEVDAESANRKFDVYNQHLMRLFVERALGTA
jgi:phosphoribosylanthranilate isomerase